MMFEISTAATTVLALTLTASPDLVQTMEQAGIDTTNEPDRAQLRSPLLAVQQQRSQGPMLALALDGERFAQIADKYELRLTDFVLAPMTRGGEPSVVNLDLSRVEVTTRDTQFVLGRLDGPDIPMARPQVAMFSGRIVGEDSSNVFLSFSPHGTHGYIETRGVTQIISGGPRGADRELLIYNLNALPPGVIHWRDHVCEARTDMFVDPGPEGRGTATGTPPCRSVKLAIETDREYTLDLFGDDENAAGAYVQTLMGAASEIFNNHINTSFELTFVRLWTTPDPWTAGGTGSQLFQYRDYWNDNMGHVNRHLGHFLSGRALGGGVAWLEAICDETNSYALSANLSGFFPYPLEDNHTQNWDIVVVAHELGHNFGAPHTHNYCPPLDECAPPGWFGQCQSQQVCTSQGTIMGYCHLCDGGQANVTLQFHPTVVQTMLDYLETINGCSLGCSLTSSLLVEIILSEGDDNGAGQFVSLVQPPFTNSLGQVGFTGAFSDGDRFVWNNDQIVWQNSWATEYTLTASTATMGIGDNGEWFYNPNISGNDGLWTHEGYLISRGDPAPLVTDMFISFTSRLQMLPDGTRYVVAGLANTSGGSTVRRIFYRIDPNGTYHKVFEDGDSVAGGLILRNNGGVGFGYHLSGNGQNHIHRLQEVGTSPFNFVYVNDQVVAYQGDAAGDGSTWNTFGSVSINNSGNYLFSGTTSGSPSGTTNYIAYNGQIVLRGGDSVADFTIPNGATLRDLSINNLGQAAHVWNWGSGSNAMRALFLGPADDLASSQLILLTGDHVDTTGDGEADHTVTQIEASNIAGPTINFSDHDFVYLRLKMMSFGDPTERDTIARVVFGADPKPTCPADLNNDGFVNVSDLLILFGAWGECPDGEPCPADLNNDGFVNVSDLLILFGAWGECP